MVVVGFQVSAPYDRSVLVSVLKWLSPNTTVRIFELQIIHGCGNIPFSFPSLVFKSVSDLSCLPMILPKDIQDFTLFRASSSCTVWLVLRVLFYRILFFLYKCRELFLKKTPLHWPSSSAFVFIYGIKGPVTIYPAASKLFNVFCAFEMWVLMIQSTTSGKEKDESR